MKQETISKLVTVKERRTDRARDELFSARAEREQCDRTYQHKRREWQEAAQEARKHENGMFERLAGPGASAAALRSQLRERQWHRTQTLAAAQRTEEAHGSLQQAAQQELERRGLFFRAQQRADAVKDLGNRLHKDARIAAERRSEAD